MIKKSVGDLLQGLASLKPDPHNPLLSFYVQDPSLLTPPLQLWKESREYGNSSLQWVFQNFLDGMGISYLNTPEYSWGYLAAKKQGIASNQIYLASQYGAKVETISRQVDRVFEQTKGVLPDSVFVFFTGNDLCAPSTHQMTRGSEYSASLKRGLEYMVRNAQATATPTHVYVLNYLSVGQLLFKPEILNHKVRAYGEDISCQDLRKRSWTRSIVKSEKNSDWAFLSYVFPPNPATVCPTLFAQEVLAEKEMGLWMMFKPQQKARAVKNLVEDMMSEVANRIRAYQGSGAGVIAEVQAWREKKYPQKNIHFHFINETAELEFSGEDLAGDCFHLNLNGQHKIAQTVLKFLNSRKEGV